MREYTSRREDGAKDRPRAIVAMLTDEDGDQVVTVLPVTHTSPSHPTLAVEIPAETKRRLGLDTDRSWVVLTEANQFVWPRPDLRPSMPGEMGSVAYGTLPESLFNVIRRKFAATLRARIVRIAFESMEAPKETNAFNRELTS
jgi:hypothetical protein